MKDRGTRWQISDTVSGRRIRSLVRHWSTKVYRQTTFQSVVQPAWPDSAGDLAELKRKLPITWHRECQLWARPNRAYFLLRSYGNSCIACEQLTASLSNFPDLKDATSKQDLCVRV